jgi:hypothetical protein
MLMCAFPVQSGLIVCVPVAGVRVDRRQRALEYDVVHLRQITLAVEMGHCDAADCQWRWGVGEETFDRKGEVSLKGAF